jgi:hypothetical protein
VWLYFIIQATNSNALPHSLSSLEILWETRTRGEDLCHARLRHSGIILETQSEEEENNAATGATATATALRHRLYKAMNVSISEGLQLG